MLNQTIALFRVLAEPYNPPLDEKRLFVTAGIELEGLNEGTQLTVQKNGKSRKLQVELLTLEEDQEDTFRLTPANTTFFGLKNGLRYWVAYNQRSRTLTILRPVRGK